MAVLLDNETTLAFQFDKNECSPDLLNLLKRVLNCNDKGTIFNYLLRKHRDIWDSLTLQYLNVWRRMDDTMPCYKEFIKCCSLCALSLGNRDLDSAIMLYARFEKLSYDTLEEMEECFCGDDSGPVFHMSVDRKGKMVKEECGKEEKGNEYIYLESVKKLSNIKKDYKRYINDYYVIIEIFAKSVGDFKTCIIKVWNTDLYKEVCKDYPDFKYNFRNKTKYMIERSMTKEELEEMIATKTKTKKKKRKGKRGGKKKRGGRRRNKKSQ